MTIRKKIGFVLSLGAAPCQRSFSSCANLKPLEINGFCSSSSSREVRRSSFPIQTATRPKNAKSQQLLVASVSTESTSPLQPEESTPLASRTKVIVSTLFIGLMAGLVGGIAGLGGGIVATPLLTALLSVSQHHAHGTSLVCVAVNSLISSWLYYQANLVQVSHSALLCLGAMLTSYVGALFTSKVNTKRLKLYFGIFLILVSILVGIPRAWIYKNAVASISVALPPSEWIQSIQALGWSQSFLLGLIGCITGFLSGLLGIGGSTVTVPFLVLLFGLSQKLAQGTSLASMIVPSILACIGHIKLKHVKYSYLPGLVTGIVFGAKLGAYLAVTHIKDSSLKVICAAIFGLVGLRYIIINQKTEKVTKSP